MTLPSSGQITINQIHVEAGGSSGTQVGINDADVRDMIGKGSTGQNTFSEYYGVSAAAPVATYKGRILTTGNGFPSGYIALSASTKIVVVAATIPGYRNTYISVGGSNMTMAADSFNSASNPNGSHSLIYYKEMTTPAQQYYFTGNGGSGRSVIYVWEITGYNSSTPSSTDTASTTTANYGNSYSETVSLSTQYNGVTIGAGLCEDTITNGVTVSNSDSLVQVDLESATNHYTWEDEGTPLGTRSYVCTQGSPGANGSNTGTFHRIAAAHWK
tara:strand:+ start:1017 stop:1832 length:816 start_codon:yes stop_codon:yes gene_type:complete